MVVQCGWFEIDKFLQYFALLLVFTLLIAPLTHFYETHGPWDVDIHMYNGIPVHSFEWRCTSLQRY